MTTNVNLVAEVKDGKPVLENVIVERIADNQFRLICSPGIVPGLAAGDEFELAPHQVPGYQLLKRGGNICVQIFFPHPASECREVLLSLAEQIGGRIDGGLETARNSLLVFTFPLSAGFSAIQQVMARAKEASPRCEWYYGNVYDLKDGVTPLNWWQEAL